MSPVSLGGLGLLLPLVQQDSPHWAVRMAADGLGLISPCLVKEISLHLYK